MNETVDPQNLLLLYLADELSPDQRMGVETMLADQPALKAQCENLQSAQHVLNEAFAKMDAGSGPIHSEAISRRVGRAIRQELTRPRMKLSGEGAPRQRRVWPWVLPAAAAASILVAAAVWIDRHVGVTNQPNPAIADKRLTPEPTTPPAEADKADDNVALWLDSFGQGTGSGSDVANTRKVEDDIAAVNGNQDPVSQYMLSSTTSRG